jgi:hypothetical protein
LAFPYIEKTNQRGDKWTLVKEGVERFYEPGRFVTFCGYELSVPEESQDHRNAYFLNSADAILLNWRDEKFRTQESWFNALKKKQVMLIPHPHINRTNWDYHCPELEPVAEICSDKGISEESDPLKIKTPSRGGIRKGLRRGYRLGIIASGDYHFNIPGRNYPCKVKTGYSGATTHKGGYMAVLVGELSREAVWNALKQRHCYATTGARIILDFAIDNHLMGEEYISSEVRNIHIQVIGTNVIDKIELIKNSRVIHAYKGRGMKITLALRDMPTEGEDRDYYYLKVKQTDGEIAWSDPIWVSKG